MTGTPGKEIESTVGSRWVDYPGWRVAELNRKLTKASDVPYVGLWPGAKHHVDHPERVENFYAHPSQGHKQGVVENSCHDDARALVSNIGHHTSEEEEQVEKDERNC